MIIKAKIGKRSKSEYFCHKLLLYEMEVVESNFFLGFLHVHFSILICSLHGDIILFSSGIVQQIGFLLIHYVSFLKC